MLGNFLSEVQQNPPLLWIVAAAAFMTFDSRCRAATTRERPYVIPRQTTRMDSDQKPSIDDPDEAAWAAAQRKRVVEYLASQRVDHGGVSLEPRWFLSPYVAVWAVRSNANPDRIGWWAISGDLPTDYISCTDERDDADVLRSFASQWKEAAAQMAAGQQVPGYRIGPPGGEKELATLLLSRAEVLEDFANDMKVGGPEDEG